MRLPLRLGWLALATALLCCMHAQAQNSELRLGIIGTDSTHALEFTRILDDAGAIDHVPGARVVAAFRGGNPSIALSRDRIEAISAELQQRWKIPLVIRISDLCPKVDGLLLLSVNAGSRRREFEQAAACGKPIFVDKPLAASLPAAESLAAYAAAHDIRWFSASAMRFVVPTIMPGKARGVDVWGPGALGTDGPLDLSWYGIHSIAILYALLGPGAKSVTRLHTANSDVLTAVWHNGRVGVVHLFRPDFPFGATVFLDNKSSSTFNNLPINYAPLLEAILGFMRGGAPPVSAAETLEIFSFMDAAQRSMQHGGIPVRLRSSTLPK